MQNSARNRRISRAVCLRGNSPRRRRRPLAAAADAAGHHADWAVIRSRAGKPLRSASDRSWPNANARARPASGITTPAQSPSAPGDSTASRAHAHRRGHARHSVLASSSGVVVQRSGSCVQTPSGISYRAVAVISKRSSIKQKRCRFVASARGSYSTNRRSATVPDAGPHTLLLQLRCAMGHDKHPTWHNQR